MERITPIPSVLWFSSQTATGISLEFCWGHTLERPTSRRRRYEGRPALDPFPTVGIVVNATTIPSLAKTDPTGMFWGELWGQVKSTFNFDLGQDFFYRGRNCSKQGGITPLAHSTCRIYH